ncbi:chloride channel protein [Amycolatopsis sp. NPDC005232]|uniref:chloride channel protein n=1 Tax=Amycolatopsis sp. NPDC005232 TaxID=3157027 RepID=UPI00339E6BF2
MRSGPLLLAAALAGAVAGVAAVAFGQAVGALRSLVAGAPPAVVVLAPVAGALLCVAVVRFVPDAGGGGIPQVRQAFAGSPLRGRVAGAKALASGAMLGSGGSGGAEGPVVHISAALGSALARAARLPSASVRPVAAAAVAGGVAASFGAPLAGVVLVAEVLVEGLGGAELVAVAIGSAAGALTGWALPGEPLRLPDVAVGGSPFGGVVAGLFGVVLAWSLYVGGAWSGWVRGVAGSRRFVADEDWMGEADGSGRPGVVAGGSCSGDARAAVGAARPDRLGTLVRWACSGWVRAGVGGVAVGLLVFAVPGVAGVGQPGAAAGGLSVLLVLAVVKVVATGVTVGAGGVVGTIGPALFVGATVGSALPIAGGAAAGMAACLAAASRAPATAVVLAVELSGLDLLPPILLAAALGWLAGLLTRHGVFDVPEPTRLAGG